MSSKREEVDPNGGKQYVRRDDEGKFTESDNQHRSLSQDDRQNAETTVKPGHGDEGDGHTGGRAPKK